MPRKQDVRNRCAVCAMPVPPGKLMCKRHWRLVPDQLQRDVMQARGAQIYAAWAFHVYPPEVARRRLAERGNPERRYTALRDEAIECARTNQAVIRIVSRTTHTGATHAQHE